MSYEGGVAQRKARERGVQKRVQMRVDVAEVVRDNIAVSIALPKMPYVGVSQYGLDQPVRSCLPDGRRSLDSRSVSL